MRLAATIGLIAGAVSIVELAATPVLNLITVSTNSTGSSLSVNATAFFLTVLFGALGIAFVLVELWLYRQAFGTLAPFDDRFSTPRSLALVAAIGIVLVSLGAVAFVGILYAALSCAAGGPITNACLNLPGILGLAGLLLVGAIIVVVGYIGVLVGIWRLGTRYMNGYFKAGAVLLIFPVLNVVGAILILVAARSVLASLGPTIPPLAFR